MKTGSEIIKEWYRDAIEDHKKNIMVCSIVFIVWLMILGFMVAYSNSWTGITASVVCAYSLMRLFVMLMEWEAKRNREEHKSWVEIQKKLMAKSKIE